MRIPPFPLHNRQLFHTPFSSRSVDKTILYNHIDGLVAILLVDLHRVGGRDPMSAQENHDLLDGLLRRPGTLDHSHPLLGNADDLDEALTMLLDDVECF